MPGTSENESESAYQGVLVDGIDQVYHQGQLRWLFSTRLLVRMTLFAKPGFPPVTNLVSVTKLAKVKNVHKINLLHMSACRSLYPISFDKITLVGVPIYRVGDACVDLVA